MRNILFSFRIISVEINERNEIMTKQELQKDILSLIKNERELTLIFTNEFVKGEMTGKDFQERLNQLFNNTNSMIESKFERLGE